MNSVDIRPGKIIYLEGTQGIGGYSFHPTSEKYDPTLTDIHLHGGMIGEFQIPGPGEILKKDGVLFYRPQDAVDDSADIPIT